jgi:hypothetical protein
MTFGHATGRNRFLNVAVAPSVPDSATDSAVGVITTPLFSQTCKLALPQPLCFHTHTNCRVPTRNLQPSLFNGLRENRARKNTIYGARNECPRCNPSKLGEVRPFPFLKLFFIRPPGDEKFYGLPPFRVTLCCQHGRPERMEFRPQRSRSVHGPPRSPVRGAWG